MSGGVAYQQGYQSNQFFGNMNTDPGVYEPECDFYDNGQPDYPDTSEFLAQYAGGMTEEGRVKLFIRRCWICILGV